MKTDDLIRALGADSRNAGPSIDRAWLTGGAAAVALAAIVFFATIGPRADFMAAAHTMRFLFKFVFTASLALTAFLCARAFSMPGAYSRRMGLALLLAPALMIAAVMAELTVMPEQTWMPRMIGTNSMICMSFIPLIGIGPLAVFIAVLRYGAPTRPVLAGALAGLLAGGLGATFYAAHCFDDSPLFVAVWYTIAIAVMAALGAIAGRVFIRW
ncbi:NrsF family protein [Mesorhizobium sp. CN5-321]|jgi:hypothetical protein|uniref:NrsF family protein n=1 Tax=Mesorhizobium hunchu TaxID=3157708 RepID=UPI0032B75C4C